MFADQLLLVYVFSAALCVLSNLRQKTKVGFRYRHR